MTDSAHSARSPDGYRRSPVGGPVIRSDIVDVYIFRRGLSAPIEFLQLLRAAEPLKDTWQPLMGHIEAGETAVQTAMREMREEVGLAPGAPALRGLWALEQVHPYFVARIDCIVLSPRFAAEAAPGWEPVLNHEHSAHRWIDSATRDLAFMWPGQRLAVEEILRELILPDSPAHERMLIPPVRSGQRA